MTELAAINIAVQKYIAGEIKRLVCDRRMDRGARLWVNQGEAEGVDFRPRLKLSPQICPQDCPRGAVAGHF